MEMKGQCDMQMGDGSEGGKRNSDNGGGFVNKLTEEIDVMKL